MVRQRLGKEEQIGRRRHIVVFVGSGIRDRKMSMSD
jgi:hypothetical protein